MVLYTLLLVAVIILLFYIKNKISDVTKNIQDKLEVAKDIAKHPKEIAASVGAAVADTALTKAAQVIRPKKRKR